MRNQLLGILLPTLISSVSNAGIWYAQASKTGKVAACLKVPSVEAVLKASQGQSKAHCQLDEKMIPTGLSFNCPGKGDLVFFRSKEHCDKFSNSLATKSKMTALEFYPYDIVHNPDRIPLFSVTLIKCVSRKILPNATYEQEVKFCDCYATHTALLPQEQLMSNRMPAAIPGIFKTCKFLAK